MRDVNAIGNAKKSKRVSAREIANAKILRIEWARVRGTMHSSDGEEEHGESKSGKQGECGWSLNG